MEYFQTFLSERSDGRLSNNFVKKFRRHGPFSFFWKKVVVCFPNLESKGRGGQKGVTKVTTFRE